ncbi:12929_t:CDS:2 [Funneliformis geosporum]|uniref:4468_t:CDS:1 n=1 Tax=Funneliformis geosporum TaxID=1117311 RepID=A0A9W4WWC6_9GLOM|nr:12929_t:CDS:2 [Funneliformis geosporum]CAI2168518.1 4468_t:CDS:2 [Funneliformis geosporum]
MTTHNFSIEDLALSLIVRLDRRNIFPPSYNNPETFIPSSDNLTKLSFRRPKRCPNAFLLCRKNVHEESNRKGTSNMRVISKVTSILWKNASPEEKDVYKKLADHVYEIHYRRISSIYKKFTSSPSSSLKEGESPSYSPYSLPLRLSKVTATAIAPSTSTPLQNLNPYPEFHGQLIAPQNDQIYFYNNVFDTQSNFSMY